MRRTMKTSNQTTMMGTFLRTNHSPAVKILEMHTRIFEWRFWTEKLNPLNFWTRQQYRTKHHVKFSKQGKFDIQKYTMITKINENTSTKDSCIIGTADSQSEDGSCCCCRDKTPPSGHSIVLGR